MQFFMTMFLLCMWTAILIFTAVHSRKKGDDRTSRLHIFMALLSFLAAVALGAHALMQSSTELSITVLVIVCVYTFIVSVAVQTIAKEKRYLGSSHRAE